MFFLIKYLSAVIIIQVIVESDTKITKGELAAISNELWSLDQNRMNNIHYNVQEQLKNENDPDHSDDRLFPALALDGFNAPSFKYFIQLLDNYNPQVTAYEDYNEKERQEEDQFLDYILKTDVMEKTFEFLSSKSLVSNDPEKFREVMKTIWFGPYSRAGKNGVLGSTGFEHVFVGEVKKSKVTGFHNWVHYYLEEQNNTINYGGYYQDKQLPGATVLSTKFRWNNFPKAVGSMFVSTTPEYEMAVYTLCFFTRPNNICKIQCNGNPVYLKAYELKANGKTYIGSAYPDLTIG